MTISKFKDKLNNTPHLMNVDTFVKVAEMLENIPDKEMLNILASENSQEDSSFNSDTGVGTIFVTGTLTYQSEWHQKYFGGTSYEAIKEKALELSDKGMSTLLMVHDSGGGSAYNCFETGNYLRKLADDNNFKILSYVDGVCASADYGLAAVSDEIIANPMANVGSIGVVVRLRNVNEAMKSAGVEDTYVHYGSQKIPYDAKGKWSKDFIDGVQANVDALGKEFTEYVASHRNIPVEAVKATEAATFSAKEAVEKKLIDSVMTHEEFYTYLADFVQKEKKPQMLKNKLFTFNSEQEKIEMKELQDAQLELSTLKTQMETEKVAQAAFEVEVVSLKASLEDAKTKLSAFEAVAAQLEADKAAVVKAQADALAVSRKAELSAALPSDKVEAAYAALADVSETVFKFAVSGYQKQEEDKSKNPLFREIGGEGEAAEVFDPVKAQAEYNKKHYNK